jgi:hypothetical protein
VPIDRRTLNLVAAVLCGIGSLATLLTARGRRDGVAALSGLLGTIGSAAWAAAAYDDLIEAKAQADSV